jgi:hypothetical protein
MTKVLFGMLSLVLVTGCMKRAPTTYELDRRAGFGVPGADHNRDALDDVHTSSAVARSPRMPVKVPPLIERVWVSDLPLGDGARLQGTWLFLEVEKGRWLDEVDPGGAPLLDLDWKRRAPRTSAPPASSVTAPAANEVRP